MRRNTILLMLAALFSACDPEDVPVSFADPSAAGARARVSFSVTGDGMKSKSILGDPEDVESMDSGCQLMVYFHDTGMLEGVYNLESRISSVELTAGRPLELYVVGNLWYIDKATGGKAGYADLLGDAFPTESDAPADISRLPAYRFDGRDVGSGLRTETFAEVASYGIPYAGSNTAGIIVRDGSSVVVEVKRLFARVDVTVDHTGIDGGVADSFRNGRLHLRQASCLVHPFVPMRAECAEDILAEADCEPAMANDRQMTFTLYVPENRQTEVGFINDDPSGKTPEALVAQGQDAIVPYLTYVEYTATADASAGGYGGDFTYRFFLGENATDSFDIERGRRYHVRLGFKASSLFEPYWKVNGTVDDSRHLYFSADRDGTLPLAEGQTVSVRSNRPASFYVYFNRSGASGSNEAASCLDEWHEGYSPSGLSRSAFRYEFSADVAACGITPSYNASTGEITIAVTDPSRFSTGDTFTLTLTLYPGGESRTVTVRTFEDIHVELQDASDWFVAQRRDVTVKGLAGGSITYRLTTGDDCLKDGNAASDPFIGTAPRSVTGTQISLYAYKASAAQTLLVESDDPFNDGTSSFTFELRRPYIYRKYDPEWQSLSNYISYTIRGDRSNMHYWYGRAQYYREADWTNPDNILPRDSFDDAVYAQTLLPSVVFNTAAGSGASTMSLTTFSGLDFDMGEKGTSDYGYELFTTFLRDPDLVETGMGPVEDQFTAGAPSRLFYSSRAPYVTLYNCFCMQSADGLSRTPSANVNLCNIWRWDSPFNPGGEMDFGDIAFADLHDYSMVDPQQMSQDSDAYRSLHTTFTQYATFGVRNADDLEFVIEPDGTCASMPNNALSGSFELLERDASMDKVKGNLHFDFVDMPSGFHSAGGHNLSVKVTNRHSGKSRTQLLGKVNIHLYLTVGAACELESVSGTDRVTWATRAVMVSDYTRTSVYDQDLTLSGVMAGDAMRRDGTYVTGIDEDQGIIPVQSSVSTEQVDVIGSGSPYRHDELQRPAGMYGIPQSFTSKEYYMRHRSPDLVFWNGTTQQRFYDRAYGSSVPYYHIVLLKDVCPSTDGWAGLYDPDHPGW